MIMLCMPTSTAPPRLLYSARALEKTLAPNPMEKRGVSMKP